MSPKTGARPAESAADDWTHEHALLEFAVSHSPSIFYVADYAGERALRFISANIESLTGHPRAAWRADPLYGRQFIHPDDRPGYVQALDSLAERGSLSHEYRFRMLDGSWRWFRDALRLIRNETTGAAEFVGCMIDITEERRARARLREREEHFRRLVEHAPVCIHELDREARISALNPKARELHGGADESSFLGRAFLDFVAPPDRERVGGQLARALAGEPQRFEYSGVEARRRHFLTSEIPVRADDGEVEKLVGITLDVTGRIEREADLRQARETLEDAIESLYEGFALYDAEDRLIMCNDRYREFNRVCADILVPGMRYETLIRTMIERGQYPDAVGRVDEWVGARLAECDDTDLHEVRLADGRWFERSHRRTRQGGTVVIRTDVTQRKRMEQALRESEALIRRVVEACPVPIGMSRAEDGLMIYESPSSQGLFGVDPEGPAPFARDRFLDPQDRVRYLERLRRKGAIDGHEVQLRKADGTTFWAELSARLIEYQGEEVIVSSTFDLTERREVAVQMQRQRDLVHQSEKLSALGELLAGVAHELNNPLSVVVGQAVLLEETSDDPALAERARRIGAAADRCARIVKSFLAMARQQSVSSLPVSMNDVVSAALEMTGYSLRSSDITVRTRLARDLPAVRADASQLGQVIANLILNAQYALQEVDAPRVLKISTSWRKRTREVVVKVKDNGPGVPEQIRSRIFEPFFTTKEVGKGTGIGLAVVHRIVDAHGGTVELENTPGGGASFAIRLPAADVPVVTPAPKPRRGSGSPLRALVVDDEPDVASMIADVLRGDGHEVDIVSSGRSALEALGRRRYDVVLSDLRMADVDGPGLLRALERSRPEVVSRLAFLTGDTMSPRVRTLLSGLGRPHLEKPVTPAELRALVRTLVDENVAPRAPGDP